MSNKEYHPPIYRMINGKMVKVELTYSYTIDRGCSYDFYDFSEFRFCSITCRSRILIFDPIIETECKNTNRGFRIALVNNDEKS